MSVVNQLRRRELHGTLRCKKYGKLATSSKIFPGNVPSRLAYSLRDIVGNVRYLLHEPHVFLGFSSDGVFVISYTKNYAPFIALSVPVPSEVYHLHWWLFNLQNKMVKVKTVRLFENEEISGNDLALHYVEWPTEKSQVIIYGLAASLKTAFVTICSVPSTSKCVDCVPKEGEVDATLCLKHGFSAHLKYNLDPSPKIYNILHGFNINNLVIMNMGYSISVTSIGLLPDDKSTSFLPLSSIKRAPFEDKPECLLKNKEEEDFAINHELLLYRSELINALPLPVDNFLLSTQTESDISSTWDMDTSSINSWSSATPTNDVTENHNLSVESYCSCKSDDVNHSSHEQNNSDPYLDFGHKTISLSGSNCNQNSKNKNNLPSNENCCCKFSSTDKCAEHVNVNTSSVNNSDSYVMPLSPKNNQTNNRASKYQNVVNEKKSKLKLLRNRCGYCGLEYRDSENNKNLISDDGLPKPKVTQNFQKPISKLLKFQSSVDKKETFMEYFMKTPSPSASESGSSIHCPGSTNSQNRGSDGIVSFTETIYGPVRTIQDQESSNNANFSGPLTIFGANKLPLGPLKPEKYKFGSAYSQHLVLDIEHVIFDVLRTRCYKTYKFGYLIDYAVQIIDTCPSTYSVILVISAILSLSCIKTKHLKHYLNSNSKNTENNFLKFQFFLSWQLQTGRYEVIGASPLFHCNKDNAKVDVERITKLAQLLRVGNSVPKKYLNRKSSVYVLNNQPVLHKKSLYFLWDAEHIIALKR